MNQGPWSSVTLAVVSAGRINNALKLAEVACLTEQLGSAPILLLDDVSSELDREHTATLFAALAATDSQLWVSSTGAVELPLPAGAQLLEVQAGEVREVAS